MGVVRASECLLKLSVYRVAVKINESYVVSKPFSRLCSKKHYVTSAYISRHTCCKELKAYECSFQEKVFFSLEMFTVRA